MTIDTNGFDPNAACAPNENYFGFPYRLEQCPLVLLSVPWDVTTSYRPGSASGPEAIRKASAQLDFFDFEIPQAWELGIGTYPLSESLHIAELSQTMRPLAEKLIAFQEGRIQEAAYPQAEREKDYRILDAACEKTNAWVDSCSSDLLSQGKVVGLVGGDHSSPLGLYKALSRFHDTFGILHFDAHDDLRNSYEGFRFSHASVMYNALDIEAVSKLVQIGVRDVCQEEQDLVFRHKQRICQFPDIFIQKRLFEGHTWNRICHDIIACLPEKIHISFDIDALQPAFCPHTGTPVPGGLDFAQVRYLLSEIRQCGKEIIGFDLCEVAPDPHDPENEWDGNVGARILYLLSNTILASVSKRKR